MIAFDEREMEYVRELYDRGVANGVPGVRIIDRRRRSGWSLASIPS